MSQTVPQNTSWWLRLTTPAGTQQYNFAPTRKERERLRKAGLISGVAPFVFFGPILLVGQASDPATLIAIISCMIAAIIALLLNRLGKQTTAALLLVLAIDVVIENGLVEAPGGLGTAWLLSFDLFLFPLFIAGMLLSHRYLWFFMLLHSALILGDFFLLHRAQDLVILVQQWGPTVAIARPIILEIGICLLAFFQIKSTNQAIDRADRAEEVAALEHAIAEQNKQLEIDIQKLSEVLSQAANGHFSVRATVERGSVLWNVAAKINTLLTRLQGSRQSDTALRQIEVDLTRIVEAIRASRHTQHVVWPLPNGGPTDTIVAELRATLFGPSSGKRL